VRTHLFGLAGYRVAGAEQTARVTPALRTLLDELEPNPAYLLDRCWNIVAWNAAEERLFPKLATFDQPPNLLRLVFLDDDLARLMLDHAEELVRLVAQFRLHRSDWPDDPDIEDVVDGLAASSPTFARLWEANDVSPFATTRRVFDRADLGRVEYDHHRLAVLDQPGMQLVVYLPAH
jgi:hypothetical protein